jgi:ABC-type multidrug transport system fused ATPase/permease subunit
VQPLSQAAASSAETLAPGAAPRATDRERRSSTRPTRSAPPAPFAVALEGVRARYAPGEPPALDGVDLGSSRAGASRSSGRAAPARRRSSNLLVRFLDPEAGRVTLGGATCASTAGGRPPRDRRRRPGLAPLLDDDPRESSASAARRDGRRDRGRAPAARILDWVRSLPDGWDTLVGEEGRELSGGQRQRLVVARALLATRRCSCSTSRPRTSTRRPPSA